jgi:DNA-binding NarL/FixJ family response regulator
MRRVLVVEDSPALRSRITARLREAGFDVAGEAGTLAGALELAAALRPDAVLLDLKLPDGLGLHILAALKAPSPAPVVVVLSIDVAYRERALAAGADAFFDKAARFDDVISALTSREPPR